jgi:hypothetical protein
MGRAVGLFGFTALLISCSSGPPTVGGAAPVELGASERCDSVVDTLPPDKSLEGLEGRYRLTLVKTEGVSKSNGAYAGWLYLWRTSELDSSAATGQRAVPGDTTRMLYFGTTDVDLGAAEAYAGDFWQQLREPPTRASVDPVYPPILGHVRRGVYHGRAWVDFTFGVGSFGNARDGSTRLDGAGVGLNVQRVDPGGLFGYWDAYGIVKTGRGYFCAHRARV